MMTSVVACGNGSLSSGRFRGLASEANLVLVKVGSAHRIVHDDIRRGILWVLAHRERYNIRVLNISCGGDYEESYLTDGLSQAADDATRNGIVVVAAAGNAVTRLEFTACFLPRARRASSRSAGSTMAAQASEDGTIIRRTG